MFRTFLKEQPEVWSSWKRREQLIVASSVYTCAYVPIIMNADLFETIYVQFVLQQIMILQDELSKEVHRILPEWSSPSTQRHHPYSRPSLG